MDDTYRIEGSERRSWAIIAHLSGLAGYIIPLGGVVAPIIIMVAKSEERVVAAIARQALLLNLVAFVSALLVFVMFLTVILIPFAIVYAILMGIAVVCLPILGAIKAADGVYYRYPGVGQDPAEI